MLPSVDPGRIGLVADRRGYGRTLLFSWFTFRDVRRCSPLEPKYPTITIRFRLSSRWTFRFQLCMRGLRKSSATVCGASPDGPATASALSRRMAPVKLRGVTLGGLPAVGV